MEIEYKLQVFEGPLDLLLHVIEKNKVDIYDIPIVTITEQYLDYVSEMQEQDMERRCSVARGQGDPEMRIQKIHIRGRKRISDIRNARRNDRQI